MSLSEEVLASTRRSRCRPASVVWWERANFRFIVTLFTVLLSVLVWGCVERTAGVTIMTNLMMCAPSAIMLVMTVVAYAKHLRAYHRGD